MITQEIINNSIEVKWRKKQRDLILKCCPIFIIFTIMCLFIMKDYKVSLIEKIGITLIILIPLLFMCIPMIIGTHIIYKKTSLLLKDYKLYKVLLNRPIVPKAYIRSLSYNVTFEIENGEKITKKTPPIFTHEVMGKYTIEQYNNQEVYIAYSKSNNKMLVIGKQIYGEY